MPGSTRHVLVSYCFGKLSRDNFPERAVSPDRPRAWVARLTSDLSVRLHSRTGKLSRARLTKLNREDAAEPHIVRLPSADPKNRAQGTARSHRADAVRRCHLLHRARGPAWCTRSSAACYSGYHCAVPGVVPAVYRPCYPSLLLLLLAG